jgi:hypothetical protein
MLDIQIAKPLHLQIEFEYISIPIKNLRTTYLDYAVACSLLENCMVSLEFSGLGLEQVKIGENFSNLSLYSPSKNDDAGNLIIDADLLRKREEDLKNIIKEKFGNSIEVPKIKK